MVVNTLNPALRRQSQVNICEIKASLVYRVSSRIARATQRNPVSKKQDSGVENVPKKESCDK